MAPKDTTEKLSHALTAMAQAIVERVNENVKSDWNLARFDIRSEGVGGTWLSKLSVDLADGTTEKGIIPPKAATRLFADLWSIRDEVFSEKWHGVKLFIRPDAAYETTFDYNPKCVNDPWEI